MRDNEVVIDTQKELLDGLDKINNLLDEIMGKLEVLEGVEACEQIGTMQDMLEFKMENMLEDPIFQIIHNTLLMNSQNNIFDASVEVYMNLNEFWDDCDEI